MSVPTLPESEWSVMEVLWSQSPQTASAVARAMKEKKGWAENTVRTLLSRLVDKCILKTVEPKGMHRLYVPTVEREAFVEAESESFLDRIFQGAAKPLLLHFASNARLTAEEVTELKQLLDQSINNKTQP